jgi:hypothetical protein
MDSRLLLVRLGRPLCITSLSIKVSSFPNISKLIGNVVNSLKCLSLHQTSSLHPPNKSLYIPIPSMDLTFLLWLHKLLSERELNCGCANKSQIARIIDNTYWRELLLNVFVVNTYTIADTSVFCLTNPSQIILLIFLPMIGLRGVVNISV